MVGVLDIISVFVKLFRAFIGVTGYPGTGYETRRTERNVTGGSFAKQAAEAAQAAGQATATLNGAEEGSGDITIFSGAELVSGSSYPTPLI